MFYYQLPCLCKRLGGRETNGSIEFLQQNEISMAKERLLIASDRINVDYVFINHSAQDITVPVAFPMPAISQRYMEIVQKVLPTLRSAWTVNRLKASPAGESSMT